LWIAEVEAGNVEVAIRRIVPQECRATRFKHDDYRDSAMAGLLGTKLGALA
jgi:hypothetical protein